MPHSSSSEEKALFRVSQSSWTRDGYFQETLLDLSIDQYLETQTSWLQHWEKIPTSEKSLKYLIPK
jgi:hypothetical protein